VSSMAFGRERPPRDARLALDKADVQELEALIEETIAGRGGDFESGFIAESPAKLRRLPQYYAALAGDRPFPAVACNAPYMSVVVEANGSVRPCFFHEPVGNVRDAPLGAIVARNLPAFRRNLDVASNPVCARCVCSIKTGWRSAPWQ
jgi:MoaA/NifB/PqqE/SkfB family radical SAM enzyme